jgi:hypothetical protein
VVEQIRPAQGGEGGIVGFEEILIEVVHIAPQGEGFSYAWITGQKEDAASAFDIIEPCLTFFKGLGIEHLLSLDVFIKREFFKSEPGQEVFHGRTSPL